MIELFISDSFDPTWNLAVEEYLTYNYRSKKAVLFFWQNENTIVVGRNQNIYDQIDLTVAKIDRVNIVRRNTGGGTVYQDLGNICYSIIGYLDENQQFSIAKILEPIVNFLNQMNINASFNGKNDIMIDDFKISGNAELKTKEKILVHGTLLYDVDLNKVSRYLLPNPIKLASKKIKSNVAKLKNICSCFEQSVKVSDFLNSLISFFLQQNDIKQMQNAIFDNEIVKNLQKQKYQNWDWTYGKATSFNDKKEHYFENKGYIKVMMNVIEGQIDKIQFSGDFLGFLGTEQLEQALTYQKYESENIKKILSEFDLATMFGPNFTVDDLLSLII